MKRPLTNQQQNVYDFIRDKIVVRGYGPTVREIGEHMNIKSPNGVMCHLRALEKKGMIVRTANKSRAIELTERISRESAARLQMSGSVQQSACQLLPDGQLTSFDLASLLDGDGKFGLQVHDDSLMELSIRRGDILIAQRREQAAHGQLAIVQVTEPGGGVVQLLRLVFFENGQMLLQAASRSVPPVSVSALEVLAVVVGVVRQFGS